MTPLLRLAMSFLIAAVSGILGYIATLAAIAWGERCQPNGANCSLGGAAGLTIAIVAGLVVAMAVARVVWRRLGRFAPRSTSAPS